jgi:hypothetical protein
MHVQASSNAKLARAEVNAWAGIHDFFDWKALDMKWTSDAP